MKSQFGILALKQPLELELLLRAIRTTEHAGNRQRIRHLAASRPDWDYLARLAARHHVSSLLYLGLKRAAWSMVKEDCQASLKARFTMNLKRNFYTAEQAIRVLEAFQTEGIDVMPYKGIFIAQTLYGHLSSREVSDIDLLIGGDDTVRSYEKLVALGFESIGKLEQQQVFLNRQLQIEIDLHWQITPEFFPVRYDFRQLWGRSRAAELGGMRYRALGNEDLLLLLCIQLAKDCWERRQRLDQLQKVCDLAQLTSVVHEMNWTVIRQRVSERGLKRIFHFALALAVDLLDARIPDELSAEVASDRKALSLARQVCSLPALAETSVPPEGNSLLDVRLRLRQLLFYMRLRELSRDKWHHLGRVMGAITAAAKSR